jgi:hypothetical protein
MGNNVKKILIDQRARKALGKQLAELVVGAFRHPKKENW